MVELNVISALLLAAFGFIAGGLNALGGGGPLVTLPILVLAGVPSVEAKASGTVALFPAGIASAWVYRRDVVAIAGVSIQSMLWATFLGGAFGSVLLLTTPSSIFDSVLPWLLLITTLTLWLGERLPRLLARRFGASAHSSRALVPCQFFVGIYAGYFGGAVGLMMMAIWSAFGHADIKASNASRAFLVNFANAVAILVFMFAGSIYWEQTAFMATGAIAGGVTGAMLGRKLAPALIRRSTLTLASVATAAFFMRAYL